MKKIPKAAWLITIVFITLSLILADSAISHNTAYRESLSAAAYFAQTTATPSPADASEIGSTDGIVLMGVIIVLIVIIPILIRRKSWSDD